MLAALLATRYIANSDSVRDVITWRRLQVADFPLLRHWLMQPHVARWWNHETSSAAVERDFGPAACGQDPSEDMLALLDGEPFGIVQRCRLADEPEYLADLRAVVEVPDEAMTIDYLIGEAGNTGRGLGTQMIHAMIERTWTYHGSASCIIVPVAAGNRASWRALEKAGMQRVAEGPMRPDNPIDGPEHVIYRVDRP